MIKDTAVLTDPYYNTPNTSLLIFRFEPNDSKLKACSTKHASIEGKDLYVLDGLFSENESFFNERLI